MQIVGGLAAMVLVIILVAGVAYGFMYMAERADLASAERNTAKAAKRWADAGYVDAITNRNSQRDADFRMNLMLFATVFQLSGGKDIFMFIAGAVAGLVGAAAYMRIAYK